MMGYPAITDVLTFNYFFVLKIAPPEEKYTLAYISLLLVSCSCDIDAL